MAALLFALIAGVSYGAADFAGGFVTRHHDAIRVIFSIQVVSLVGVLVTIGLTDAGDPTGADLLWGIGGGVAVPLALVFLYRALAIGPMSTAASITALVGAATPILAGLTLGERPAVLGLVGMALTFPAIYLVSLDGGGPESDTETSDDAERSRMRRFALLAGVGFGAYFVFLSRSAEEAGLSPLIVIRLTSLALLGLLILRSGGWDAPARRWWPHIAAAGALEAVANVALLAAFDGDNLAWVATISSLYPASTILLARILLRERFTRPQMVGLGAAALALVFIAVGR